MSASVESQCANTQDCPICGWSADTIFSVFHHRKCQAWKRACRDMSYTPMTYPQAQGVVAKTRSCLKSCDTPHERLAQVMLLTQALYDISLGIAITEGYHLQHPDLETFRAMLDLPEISGLSREQFPHSAGHIAPGAKAWYPKGSRNYKHQMKARR